MKQTISDLIYTERQRQDAKWGVQNHDNWKWLAILVEEVGEAAKAILKAWEENGNPEDVRKELVEVVAVVFAWLECIERKRET